MSCITDGKAKLSCTGRVGGKEIDRGRRRTLLWPRHPKKGPTKGIYSSWPYAFRCLFENVSYWIHANSTSTEFLFIKFLPLSRYNTQKKCVAAKNKVIPSGGWERGILQGLRFLIIAPIKFYNFSLYRVNFTTSFPGYLFLLPRDPGNEVVNISALITFTNEMCSFVFVSVVVVAVLLHLNKTSPIPASVLCRPEQ